MYCVDKSPCMSVCVSCAEEATHAHTNIHIHKYTHTYTYAHTNTCVRRHVQVHAQIRVCIHTHAERVLEDKDHQSWTILIFPAGKSPSRCGHVASSYDNHDEIAFASIWHREEPASVPAAPGRLPPATQEQGLHRSRASESCLRSPSSCPGRELPLPTVPTPFPEHTLCLSLRRLPWLEAAGPTLGPSLNQPCGSLSVLSWRWEAHTPPGGCHMQEQTIKRAQFTEVISSS